MRLTMGLTAVSSLLQSSLTRDKHTCRLLGSLLKVYVPRPPLPKTATTFRCHLCTQTIGITGIIGHDFLLHVYNSCETAKYWWQKLDFANPMNLREMLAPTNTSQDNLENLNWFFSTAHKIYTRRMGESKDAASLARLESRDLKRLLGETHPAGR